MFRTVLGQGYGQMAYYGAPMMGGAVAPGMQTMYHPGQAGAYNPAQFAAQAAAAAQSAQARDTCCFCCMPARWLTPQSQWAAHLPPLQAAAYGGAATAQYGATTVLNPAAAKQHAAALADDAPPARPEQTQQVGVFACVQGISIRSRVVCFLSSACLGAERRSTALAQ